jgi:hypothetical protein
MYGIFCALFALALSPVPDSSTSTEYCAFPNSPPTRRWERCSNCCRYGNTGGQRCPSWGGLRHSERAGGIASDNTSLAYRC